MSVNPKALVVFFLFSVSTALVGCGTVVYLIKDEPSLAEADLQADEGLLVARIFTDFADLTENPALSKLGIPESVILKFKKAGSAGLGSSGQELMKFANWDPLVTIKVPAGTYEWYWLNFRVYTYGAPLEKQVFDVKANSFNYVGDIYVDVVENRNGNYSANLDGKDGEEEVIVALKNAFPNATNRYKFENVVALPKLSSGTK